MALDWTAIHGAGSAETFARLLEQTPRLIVGASTSITGALRFAMRQFDRNGFEGRRLVIDLSGDGRHNQSTGPTVQRALAVNMGITINGLAILNEDHQLDRYYRDHVIGGTGAFVMTADSYGDFAAAIVQKLVREISGSPLALLPREVPPDPEPNPRHDIRYGSRLCKNVRSDRIPPWLCREVVMKRFVESLEPGQFSALDLR